MTRHGASADSGDEGGWARAAEADVGRMEGRVAIATPTFHSRPARAPRPPAHRPPTLVAAVRARTCAQRQQTAERQAPWPRTPGGRTCGVDVRRTSCRAAVRDDPGRR